MKNLTACTVNTPWARSWAPATPAPHQRSQVRSQSAGPTWRRTTSEDSSWGSWERVSSAAPEIPTPQVEATRPNPIVSDIRHTDSDSSWGSHVEPHHHQELLPPWPQRDAPTIAMPPLPPPPWPSRVPPTRARAARAPPIRIQMPTLNATTPQFTQ